MEGYTQQFMERVINRFISFPMMLKQAGLDGYGYGGTCFCPFHENANTPSAKLFRDPDGDTMWCFAEGKRYRPCDVVKLGMLGMPVRGLFQNLWGELSIEQKEEMLAESGEKAHVATIWDAYSDQLSMFRRGQVTLDQHITALINVLVNGRETVT